MEVDGHDLYMRCAGSPTVVYFTGWADDLSKRGVAIVPARPGTARYEHGTAGKRLVAVVTGPV